jgi:hypothetical protein
MAYGAMFATLVKQVMCESLSESEKYMNMLSEMSSEKIVKKLVAR